MVDTNEISVYVVTYKVFQTFYLVVWYTWWYGLSIYGIERKRYYHIDGVVSHKDKITIMDATVEWFCKPHI